jgi:hypothetical protein
MWSGAIDSRRGHRKPLMPTIAQVRLRESENDVRLS